MRRKLTMALVALASLGTLYVFAQVADEVSPNSIVIPVPGRPGFDGIKEFTTSGTFVVPSRVTTMLVELYGGGGGGGAECGGAAGGGGGAGAFSRSVIEVSPGSTLSVDVGAGGAGGSGSSDNGTAGASTSIFLGTTALVFANGGEGGQGGCHGGGGSAGGAPDPAAMISHAGQGGGNAFNGDSGPGGSGYTPIGFVIDTPVAQGGFGCAMVAFVCVNGQAQAGIAGYVLLTF